MSANSGQWIRVISGLALPILIAMPTWWSLRAERTVLRESKALIEADLARLATGAALGSENNRLRAMVFERKLIVEAIDRGRMGPLQWLSALGALPEGIVLTRATLTGAEWEVEGVIASNASVAALPAHFERDGFVIDANGTLDTALPDGVFRLRGRLAGHSGGGSEP